MSRGESRHITYCGIRVHRKEAGEYMVFGKVRGKQIGTIRRVKRGDWEVVAPGKLTRHGMRTLMAAVAEFEREMQ